MTINLQAGQEAPSYEDFINNEAGRRWEIAKHAGQAILPSPVPVAEAQPAPLSPQINE